MFSSLNSSSQFLTDTSNWKVKVVTVNLINNNTPKKHYFQCERQEHRGAVSFTFTWPRQQADTIQEKNLKYQLSIPLYTTDELKLDAPVLSSSVRLRTVARHWSLGYRELARSSLTYGTSSHASPTWTTSWTLSVRSVATLTPWPRRLML